MPITYSFDQEQRLILARVAESTLNDFASWLALAREVEPLFGPMAEEAAFRAALKQAISSGAAFCIRSDPDQAVEWLQGGIIISKASNEIAWLAVSERCRGMGLGRQLLEYAIRRLHPLKDIWVQTFDASVPEGRPARKLYLDSGFADVQDGGLNPAGIPTVIMKLAAATAGGI